MFRTTSRVQFHMLSIILFMFVIGRIIFEMLSLPTRLLQIESVMTQNTFPYNSFLEIKPACFRMLCVCLATPRTTSRTASC